MNNDSRLSVFGVRLRPIDARLGRFVLRLMGIVLLLGNGSLWAQETKIYEQEPYDVITLNAANQGRILRVMPLDLPERRVVPSSNPNATLRIRLMDNPDEEIDVAWGGIEKIDLFEDRVLRRARQLVRSREFDDAFEHLGFLQNSYPNTVGLEETVDSLLFAEASALYRERRFDRAILLLNEVYQRNPNRRGLVTALTRVSQALFAERIKSQDYRDARRIVQIADDQYGSNLADSVRNWKRQLQSIAENVLGEARQYSDDGNDRAAYVSSRRAYEIWPDTPGVREMMVNTARRYPILSVAVSQRYAPSNERPMFNWANRRASRLEYRRLFELTGVGPNGGIYECPVGKPTIADDYRGLSIQMLDLGGDSAAYIGMAVSRRLLEIANPERPAYDPAWAMVFRSLDLVGTSDLQLTLRRPSLTVQALLDTDAVSGRVPQLRQAWQPYTLDSSEESPDRQRFVLNPDYALVVSTQPREVIERDFDNPKQAIQALRSGEVDLLDRIFPADVEQVSRDETLVVQPYRIPSLHVLVPNQNRPHPSNRIFRRAIAYAIDREQILKRDLLGGFELSGCELISGPFPLGIASDDPLNYAYNTNIDPLPYDPRHARTLIQLAQIGLEVAAEKAKQPKPQLDEIVVAHPPSDIARIACNEIVEDLKVLGLKCVLRVLAPGESRPADDAWDFLYLDYLMGEPLVDARRLLASDGFAGCASPHLNLAIRRLDQLNKEADAPERLRVVHQICFDDMSVIPLWQIQDRLARRKIVEGVEQRPVATYQDIEKWSLRLEK